MRGSNRLAKALLLTWIAATVAITAGGAAWAISLLQIEDDQQPPKPTTSSNGRDNCSLVRDSGVSISTCIRGALGTRVGTAYEPPAVPVGNRACLTQQLALPGGAVQLLGARSTASARR